MNYRFPLHYTLEQRISNTQTEPTPMSTPLYLIRTDAVLIHPSLPGFPILNPPRMAAAPDSPHAQFITATIIPPVSWPGTLAWYGLKQPHRGHMWPLRALLHIYLLLSTHQNVNVQDGSPSAAFIHAHPETSYQTLLDSGEHYIGNFWPRIPEMLLLALSKAKEPMVPVIINALASAAKTNDRQYGSCAIEDFSVQLTDLVRRIQTAVSVLHSTDELQSIGLTRRRAGVIERALIQTLRTNAPSRAMAYSVPLPTMPKTNANRLVAEQRAVFQKTMGDDHAVTITAPPSDFIL